jgi:hypothetical protein
MDPLPISTSVFYKKRYINLESAIDDLDDDEGPADLVIIPPSPDYLTDNDDIDDDNIQDNVLPPDVPGGIEVFASHEDSDSEDEIPLAAALYRHNQNQPKQKKQKTKKTEPEPKWTKRGIDIVMNGTNGFLDRENNVKTVLKDLSSVEIFQKLFDDEIIKYLVAESKRYALQKNNHNFIVTDNEIKNFIGILLFSGYHKLPRERLYWSLDEDLGTSVVASSMSRNRYHEIKKYFHLCNNEEDQSVRPLMNKLNKNFIQWGIFDENLSIDEAMIKYYGHHSSKQFIRGKPVRFGYKDWMLCSSSGYCYKFDTYCGAKQEVTKLPLGSKVVLDLLEVVDNPSDHIIFFDNYFSSHLLIKQLRDMGYRATGTIRDNRVKKCPLSTKLQTKNEKRGYFDFRYDAENLVLLVRWKDNSLVTMITNYDCIQPMAKVKRWSKEQKEKIDVPQPRLFAAYNNAMGDVDLLDQAVNNYRVTIQGKKWWWPLWTHMLKVSVVNAWRLHSLVNNNTKVDLLQFVREITRYYLRNFEKHSIQRRPPTVPRSIAQSEFGHFPKKLSKQARCRLCHQRIRWQCMKCNVTLCIERDCFINFHC